MDDKDKTPTPEGDEATHGKEQVTEGENQEVGKAVDPEAFYDKSKSFFDKISCNALDSLKDSSRRPDWKAVKKVNLETFGTSGNFNPGRGRRGSFQRGRGGSGNYNRSRGGGYNKTSNGYNQGGFYGGQFYMPVRCSLIPFLHKFLVNELL